MSESPFSPEEVYVGRPAGCREVEITPAMVERYIAGTGDENPWYTGASPLDVALAPALLLHSETFVDTSWFLRHYGALHARLEWNAYRPIAVGDVVTSRCTIVDRYRKRERDYVVNEALLFDSSGRLAARDRAHHSFLVEANAQQPVVSSQSARREIAIAAQGEPLPTTVRAIDLERCRAFTPGRNYHTDLQSARKLGFPAVVVQGMLPVCLIAELLTARFGLGFYFGGSLNLNMVNILWAGETVETGGTILERIPEGKHTRARLSVWCGVKGGAKVVVGSASALDL